MNTKLFIAAIAIALCANVALAQSSNDFHKWEVSGGYSRALTQSTIGTEVVAQPTGPYNPIFAGQRNLVGGPVPTSPIVAKGRTAQNFTIGVGVAFH